eukprot:gene168-780_t
MSLEPNVNSLVLGYLKCNHFNNTAKEFESECKASCKQNQLKSVFTNQHSLAPNLESIVREYCALKKAEKSCLSNGQAPAIINLWQQFDAIVTQLRYLTTGKRNLSSRSRIVHKVNPKSSYHVVSASIPRSELHHCHQVDHATTNQNQHAVISHRTHDNEAVSRLPTPEAPTSPLVINENAEHLVDETEVPAHFPPKSPKRKRIRPKKKAIQDWPDKEPSIHSSDSSKTSVAQPMPDEINHIFDALLNSKVLQEKIASNINKYVSNSTSAPENNGHSAENNLIDTYSTINVDEILNLTKTDPSFQSLFNFFDDKELSLSNIQTPFKPDPPDVNQTALGNCHFYPAQDSGIILNDTAVLVEDEKHSIPNTSLHIPDLSNLQELQPNPACNIYIKKRRSQSVPVKNTAFDKPNPSSKLMLESYAKSLDFGSSSVCSTTLGQEGDAGECGSDGGKEARQKGRKKRQSKISFSDNTTRNGTSDGVKTKSWNGTVTSEMGAETKAPDGDIVPKFGEIVECERGEINRNECIDYDSNERRSLGKYHATNGSDGPNETCEVLDRESCSQGCVRKELVAKKLETDSVSSDIGKSSKENSNIFDRLKTKEIYKFQRRTNDVEKGRDAKETAKEEVKYSATRDMRDDSTEDEFIPTIEKYHVQRNLGPLRRNRNSYPMRKDGMASRGVHTSPKDEFLKVSSLTETQGHSSCERRPNSTIHTSTTSIKEGLDSTSNRLAKSPTKPDKPKRSSVKKTLSKRASQRCKKTRHVNNLSSENIPVSKLKTSTTEKAEVDAVSKPRDSLTRQSTGDELTVIDAVDIPRDSPNCQSNDDNTGLGFSIISKEIVSDVSLSNFESNFNAKQDNFVIYLSDDGSTDCGKNSDGSIGKGRTESDDKRPGVELTNAGLTEDVSRSISENVQSPLSTFKKLAARKTDCRVSSSEEVQDVKFRMGKSKGRKRSKVTEKDNSPLDSFADFKLPENLDIDGFLSTLKYSADELTDEINLLF